MTIQPAHCPVCHEPIGESCIRSLAIVPRSDNDKFARFLRDQIAVSFHRCKCGAKTSMDSSNNATYAAPQAASICCPVCGKPIDDSAIVISCKLRDGLQVVLDGAPETAEVPSEIHFQCECGASVGVTDANQGDDHLSLFGRSMRHIHRGRHVFMFPQHNPDTFIRSADDGSAAWQYETLGFESEFTFATKFDARDACERTIRDLSSRLNKLIEGGMFGL